ncbi:aldolase [Thozetella sp. PMI_491]|nr:aldolase [Thozetella sp. PMI_491]
MPRPPLLDNRVLKIVHAARDGNYAVPAICCYNIEAVIATVRAAEAAKSPAIVQLFPWAIEYAGNALVFAAAEACHSASVPIALHLDHCQSPELVKPITKEENLALTKELVQYLHDRDICAEAEPGRIEVGEDGIAGTVDLEGVLTTPAQAEEFIALGIELLAPAFGNLHSSYGPCGINLEYDRLETINKAVGDRVSLVLHGSDPFDEEVFGKCIRAGVADIQKEMEGKPLTAVMETCTKRMQGAVERYMKWFGSAVQRRRVYVHPCREKLLRLPILKEAPKRDSSKTRISMSS